MALRLSNASTCAFRAAMNKSSSSRGTERSGASCGSTRERSSLAHVFFAEPCSPVSTSTGYGPLGVNAARIHATASVKSSSLARFRKVRRLAIDPPLSGIGSLPDCLRSDESHGWPIDDTPASLVNLDRPPRRIAQVEIQLLLDRSDAPIRRILLTLKSGHGLDSAERRLQRFVARRAALCREIAMPKPQLEPSRSNRTSLTMSAVSQHRRTYRLHHETACSRSR